MQIPSPADMCHPPDCSAGAVRNRLGGLRTKANKGEFGKATAGSKSKGGASALSTPSKATPTDDLVASTTPSRSSSSKGHKKKGNAEIDVHEDESAMPRNKKRKVDEVGDDDDDEEVFSEALMGGNRMDVKAELVDDDDDF